MTRRGRWQLVWSSAHAQWTSMGVGPRSPQGLVDGWWLVGGANMLKVDFFCSASTRSGRVQVEDQTSVLGHCWPGLGCDHGLKWMAWNSNDSVWGSFPLHYPQLLPGCSWNATSPAGLFSSAVMHLCLKIAEARAFSANCWWVGGPLMPHPFLAMSISRPRPGVRH